MRELSSIGFQPDVAGDYKVRAAHALWVLVSQWKMLLAVVDITVISADRAMPVYVCWAILVISASKVGVCVFVGVCNCQGRVRDDVTDWYTDVYCRPVPTGTDRYYLLGCSRHHRQWSFASHSHCLHCR
jgi:hypothetical protein